MKYQISNPKNVVKIILKNRGIKTRKEIEEFLNPKLENVTIDSVGIDKKQLRKAIARIELAIKNKEKIVVYGDYDVDGISGTAILWETLNSLGAKVMPYIPHRIDEGYGLSVKGINNVILNLFQDPKRKEMLKPVQHDIKKGLIITVDNGIVANKAVDFTKEKNIDVIITDHHVPPKKLPNALAIVHTTMLCGTGVAWMLSQSLLSVFSSQLSVNSHSVLGQSVPTNRQQANRNPKTENREPITEYLSLVELYPKSGRTHQIRVHLQYIHHPIFADPLYAGRKTSRQDRKLLPRVFLHASKISLYHPKTEKQISLESPLPKELGTFLDRLKP